MKDADERKVGRAFSNAMVDTALASIPGLYGLCGGPVGGDTVRRVPAGDGARRPRAAVRPRCRPHARGRRRWRRPTVRVDGGPQASGRRADVRRGPHRRRVPLGHVAGARSGDKGGDANLGVFARSDAALAWLDGFLTVGAPRGAAARDRDR